MKRNINLKFLSSLILLFALPVLVWAFSTQKFDIRNKAQTLSNTCSVSSDCGCGIDSKSNYCAITNKESLKSVGCPSYPEFCNTIGSDTNCKPTCSAGLCTLGCPKATPYPIPDCTNLEIVDANISALKVGTPYTFKLTASVGNNNSPVTSVEITPVGEKGCYDFLKGYAPLNIDGAGTYELRWIPPKAGKFTIIGNVWNDSRTQCRSDCIDGYPRSLCASSSSCKLTGEAFDKILPTPSPTPIKNELPNSPSRTFNPQPTGKPGIGRTLSLTDVISFIVFSSIVGFSIYKFYKNYKKK